MKQNFLFFLLLALLMSSSAAWAEKSDVVTSNTVGATVSFSSSGEHEWEWDSANKKLKCLSLGYSQTTITISTPSLCTLSFNCGVCCKESLDNLTIFIDGITIVGGTSGALYGTYNYTLTKGSHTLVLRYNPTYNCQHDDYAYISNMKFLSPTGTATQSGSCGDNVKYSLYDNGTLLVISGSGKMTDYPYNSLPAWYYDYNSKILKVYIDEGVTSIGHNAFYNCYNIKSVDIPNSVTSIGIAAFSGCLRITSLTIPKSVTSIGWGAFQDCSGLTSVNIPNKVKIIDQATFSGCTGLTSVNIPNSVTSIGYNAFYNCSRLASIKIPNSVTSIERYAFWKCSGLTSLEIPNSVTTIGESAFDGCSALKEVYCSIKNVVPISSGTFYKVNTAKLYVPKESLEAYKAANCWKDFGTILPFEGSVSEITLNATSATLSISEELELSASVLPKYASNREVKWTSSNSSIATVDTNGKVKAISRGTAIITASTTDGSNLSASCEVIVVETGKLGNNITYTFYGDGLLVINGTGAMPEYSRLDYDDWTNYTSPFSHSIYEEEDEYGFGIKIKSVVIGEGITRIGNWTFPNCENIKSVSIPNSVTSIGNGAFSHCSSLTSVSIPNSVTSIGNYAYSGCSGLTSVTIPNSVTSISNSAFSDCALTYVEVSCTDEADFAKYVSRTDLYSILHSSYSFQQAAYNKISVNGVELKDVVIPNNVTSIGDYAFQHCRDLTSVTIPNSVTSIGYSAFNNCRNLTSIIIPNSVTNIDNYAFSNCQGLTSVTIPNSVTSIGNRAFWASPGLTSIVVEQGNSKYDSRDNCNAIIETITNTLTIGCKGTIIPNSVTSIGNSAFSSCSGLTSVTIPNSVTSIGSYAFAYCSGLTSVTIPNSVTSIGDYAFYDCSKLQELTCLASEVPTLGSYVFSYATNGVLYVPKESIEAYKAASQWKSWKSIEGIKESLELIDGEAYTNDEEKTYDELTFTKTFSSSVVNKWNALYVPMSINIEDYLDDFDFAEIFNISPTEDTNGDGEIDGRDANKLIVNKLKTGTTDPNKPYLIRPKQAGTYTFASADNVLYPAEEKSYSCSTMTDEYTFTGLYASQGVTGNDKYYMTINGILDFSPTKTITVKPNRWIMIVKSRNGSSSSANAKAISLSVIGEDEGTTAIEHVDAVRNDGNIYNLNGVKMDSKNLPTGIYIKNGKKVFVK